MWGLRFGLGLEDASKAEEAVRSGEFDYQRSIVYKDAPLDESVCAYGFHGKKVFPSTRTALLDFVDRIKGS